MHGESLCNLQTKLVILYAIDIFLGVLLSPFSSSTFACVSIAPLAMRWSVDDVLGYGFWDLHGYCEKEIRNRSWSAPWRNRQSGLGLRSCL
jgi:hypothetical protein